jgi:transcriptional regulator of acetoin/glycerol metabolism
MSEWISSANGLDPDHRRRQESATLEEAAVRLDIDPTTLWRKRKRYGLT